MSLIFHHPLPCVKSKRCLSILLLILLWCLPVEAEQSVFDIPLDDLLNTPVTVGGLLPMIKADAPASVTTITSDDIAMTPARTLLDILEVYVPGATFVFHYNGPRIGFRGTLGDQNDSFLLLVNGRNINLKTNDAMTMEILNRDLGDIDRIEVVRGPGSVTHGPGAIGGVINIVTRTAGNTEGWEFGSEVNEHYRYQTYNTSYGWKGSNHSGFIYAGISTSRGESDTRYFYVDRAHGYGFGFMGNDWGNKGLGTAAPALYEDYDDHPQFKLHFDGTWGDSWHGWLRYNTSSFTKITQASPYSDGNNFQGFLYSSLVTSLEHSFDVGRHQTVDSSITFDGANIRDHGMINREYPFDDWAHIRSSYSENELQLESIYRYHDEEDKYRFAAGLSASYEFWRPEWGKSDDTFVLLFRNPINFAVLSEDNPLYREYEGTGRSSIINSKPDAFSYSFFGEATLELHPRFQIFLASRMDKHEMASWAVSPRIGFLTRMTPEDSIRLILQRSVRLPAFEDLYSEDKAGNKNPDPEKLNGVEIIFSHEDHRNWQSSLSLFYNETEQIAWLPEGYAGVIGEFEIWGIELETLVHFKHCQLGFSYSLIDQIDWDPRVPIETHLTTPEGDPVYMSGDYGENRINNLPGQTLKMNSLIQLSDDVVFHMNARYYWNFGQSDMLDMFKQAHDQFGSQETREEMSAIYNAMTYRGYTEDSFTLNASLQWRLPVNSIDAYLSVYGMNLIEENHIRYIIQYWELPYVQYPRQCSFVEEPASLGIQLKLKI